MALDGINVKSRLLLLLVVGVSTFAIVLFALSEWATPPAEPDDWVVVHYEENDQWASSAFESLLETELAADEALANADAGWIDGNDVGDFAYDVYFVGHDREVMWDVLKPVFAGAPVPWTSVELRRGFEDSTPVVVLPSQGAEG